MKKLPRRPGDEQLALRGCAPHVPSRDRMADGKRRIARVSYAIRLDTRHRGDRRRDLTQARDVRAQASQKGQPKTQFGADVFAAPRVEGTWKATASGEQTHYEDSSSRMTDDRDQLLQRLGARA